jgi:DNA modification methylase
MILLGDCREQLRTLEWDSVQTCVTSPPYWGLRDYGHDGQLGLEETPDAYVAAMVEVFREVRRVLKPDGTLWLNLGDSYSGTPVGTFNGGGDAVGGRRHLAAGVAGSKAVNKSAAAGLKPKTSAASREGCLCSQADGWWLRSDIVWSKPTMPRAARPTDKGARICLPPKSSHYRREGDWAAVESGSRQA